LAHVDASAGAACALFVGIEIDAVHDGAAGSILVGIRGRIRQMQS
jgi:hypothetical protein